MAEDSYCEDHHELWKTVVEFVKAQQITCPETIFQCDWVAENSGEFIEKLCDIVGYADAHLEAPAGVEPACTDSKSAASPLRQEAIGPAKGT